MYTYQLIKIIRNGYSSKYGDTPFLVVSILALSLFGCSANQYTSKQFPDGNYEQSEPDLDICKKRVPAEVVKEANNFTAKDSSLYIPIPVNSGTSVLGGYVRTVKLSCKSACRKAREKLRNIVYECMDRKGWSNKELAAWKLDMQEIKEIQKERMRIQLEREKITPEEIKKNQIELEKKHSKECPDHWGEFKSIEKVHGEQIWQDCNTSYWESMGDADPMISLAEMKSLQINYGKILIENGSDIAKSLDAGMLITIGVEQYKIRNYRLARKLLERANFVSKSDSLRNMSHYLAGAYFNTGSPKKGEKILGSLPDSLIGWFGYTSNEWAWFIESMEEVKSKVPISHYAIWDKTIARLKKGK